MPTDFVTNRYMSKLGMPAQQVTWDESLDFDEVAKFFTMPVAEAANILGVCPTTLKRICRENGLPRWPYRKVLAGRTVEEIKREAARAKQLAAQEQMFNVQPNSLAQVSNSQNMMNPARPNMTSYGSRFSTTATLRTKLPIATFLDDFRHGFPMKGLATLSDRWWGKAAEPAKPSDNGEHDSPSEVEESVKAASRLVSIRKNKADCLRKTLNSPIMKGYNGSKINAKELAVLKFVFGEEMPKQWSYARGREIYQR